MRRFAVAVLRWVLCSVPGATAACSSTSNTYNAECGPGTTPQNGICVVAEGGTRDATTPGDAGDASASAEGSAVDAPRGVDSANEADGPSDQPDPCPANDTQMEIAFDCDPACCSQDPGCTRNETEAGVAPQCAMATCGAGPVTQGGVNGLLPYIVRTPNAPGVDGACASVCPSSGYVYGLGLDLANSSPWVLVEVAPPWEIISSSQKPYCADSTAVVSTAACAAIAAAVNPNVYVMTRDPNAPARNIRLTGAATKPSCPADGGP